MLWLMRRYFQHTLNSENLGGASAGRTTTDKSSTVVYFFCPCCPYYVVLFCSASFNLGLYSELDPNQGLTPVTFHNSNHVPSSKDVQVIATRHVPSSTTTPHVPSRHECPSTSDASNTRQITFPSSMAAVFASPRDNQTKWLSYTTQNN